MAVKLEANQTDREKEMALDIYDIIKDIKDPERPETLEELEVVKEEGVMVRCVKEEEDYV